MTLYADFQPGLYPTGLAGPYGTAWGRSQGAMKDRVITLAIDAVDAGLVLRCPADALPLLGEDVALPRLPLDTDDSYRSRVSAAWDTWPWAGTRTGLLNVFGLLNPTVTVRIATAHELHRTPWAQWFAFVAQPTIAHRRFWGAPGKWGEGTWGSDAERFVVRSIRRELRRFSNARDRGWVVILRSSPGVWGAPSVWGAPGVWGGRNARWRI
jgi:hypothetical protein